MYYLSFSKDFRLLYGVSVSFFYIVVLLASNEILPPYLAHMSNLDSTLKKQRHCLLTKVYVKVMVSSVSCGDVTISPKPELGAGESLDYKDKTVLPETSPAIEGLMVMPKPAPIISGHRCKRASIRLRMLED